MRLLPHNRELSHQVCRFVKFALPHLSHIWFSAPHSNLEPFFLPFPQLQTRSPLNIIIKSAFDLPRTSTPHSSSIFLVLPPNQSINQTRPPQIFIIASNSITWDQKATLDLVLSIIEDAGIGGLKWQSITSRMQAKGYDNIGSEACR
jgi:hypothetical protein